MSYVDGLLCNLVDTYFALRPRSLVQNIVPKIVSHRGIHDNVSVFENTMQAFEMAMQCGAWGIELDIRWTKDLCPVVIHDVNCQRIFGADIMISHVTMAELRKEVPLIPALSEVVTLYGKKMHLMIELKYEYQYEHFLHSVQEYLAPLESCKEFHILSLHPRVFECIDKLPSASFLPVAEKNVVELSELALAKGYGGITGHYFLLNEKVHQKHRAADQSIGTGFISSRNCLQREVTRGVEWVFTNHVQQIKH
ncbi:MAG: glycerophosphodiester phosphodiesterase [Candidatus Moraniibacteriota bacterium]|jgi:glycerophosphoryl diester phosphodiesterase